MFWVFSCREIRAAAAAAPTAQEAAAPSPSPTSNGTASSVGSAGKTGTAGAKTGGSGAAAEWQRTAPTAGVVWNSVRGGLEFLHALLAPDAATSIRNNGVMGDWGRWKQGGGKMESSFAIMGPIDMERLSRTRKRLGAVSAVHVPKSLMDN